MFSGSVFSSNAISTLAAADYTDKDQVENMIAQANNISELSIIGLIRMLQGKKRTEFGYEELQSIFHIPLMLVQRKLSLQAYHSSYYSEYNLINLKTLMQCSIDNLGTDVLNF